MDSPTNIGIGFIVGMRTLPQPDLPKGNKASPLPTSDMRRLLEEI
jgi:hypothetical protein